MAINQGIVTGIIEKLEQNTYGKAKITELLLKHNEKITNKDGSHYYQEMLIPLSAFGYMGNSLMKNATEGMFITLSYKIRSREYNERYYPSLIIQDYFLNTTGKTKIEGEDVPLKPEETTNEDDIPF